MKKQLSVVLSILSLGLASQSTNAFAQKAPSAPPAAPAKDLPRLGDAKGGPAKYAYFDMQSAILQTEQGKAAKALIEKEAEQKRTVLLNQQNELKKFEEEFQAQQSVLSDTEKTNKQREFQTKVTSLREAMAKFEQEVRGKEAQETQKIFQNLATIVEEVSKKKGYELVFERGAGAVLYASRLDDITTEVTGIYNTRFKGKK